MEVGPSPSPTGLGVGLPTFELVDSPVHSQVTSDHQ
jgi:hypothetical protein